AGDPQVAAVEEPQPPALTMLNDPATSADTAPAAADDGYRMPPPDESIVRANNDGTEAAEANIPASPYASQTGEPAPTPAYGQPPVDPASAYGQAPPTLA